MPDFNTDITATESLPCSKEDALEIIAALLEGSTDTDDYVDSTKNGVRFVHHYTSGICLEIDATELYIFGRDNVSEDEAPAEFWIAVGKWLKKLKMPYLEFGVAYTCSKHAPGSFGGTSFRLYPNGEIVFANKTWPTRK